MNPSVISPMELVVGAVLVCVFGIGLGLLLALARPQVLDVLHHIIEGEPRERPLVALERVCRRRAET